MRSRSHTKTSTALICLMLFGLAGVYFMYLKTGPQQASAASFEAPAAADSAITHYLNTSPAGVKQIEKSLKRTQSVVARLNAESPHAPTELRTNPFRKSVAVDDAGNAAALRERQEQQRQAALKAVAGLQLQSVLINEKNRSCMINNGLYVEGGHIDRFEVERIAPNSVIVRSGPYRFELKR